MNCPACGTENREGARFCRSCGQNLSESPVVDIEASVADVEATVADVEATVEGVEATVEGVEATLADVEATVADASTSAEPVKVSPGEPDVGSEAALSPPEEPPPADTESEAEAKAEAEEKPPAEAPEPEAEAEAPDQDVETEEAGSEVAMETVTAEAPPPEAAAEPLEEPEPEPEPLPESEDEIESFWRNEVEPLAPAEPGTVVAGRYLLVEALDVQEDEILYLAQDLQRCWQCGFEGNAPDEAFCAQCGASLERHAEAHLAQVRAAEAEPSGGQEVTAHLEDDGRFFLVLAEPQPEAEPEEAPASQSIRLVVGQRSHPGQVRELDEDSLLALTLAPTYESRVGPVVGLFAVADGMGGHEGGEVASKLALQVLVEEVMRAIVLPELGGELLLEEDVLVYLRQAVAAANDAVYLARQKAGNDMGTTLTAAYVRDQRLLLAHVGDCRAYRWNAEGLEQLTTDHSVVASMIASGQAAPEEIYTHPHRSVIYRSIGDKPTVEVDTDLLPLATGDRLILCCDGLWEMIRSEGIADAMMQEADPQLACDLMVKRANLAGGDDNISVIVVQVEAA